MTQYNPRGAASKASPQSVKVTRVPAPIKGVDTRVATSEGNPQNCVFAFNMIPSEQDVRVRKGYREHVVDVLTPQPISDGIHTIIPFHSSNPTLNPDKLFCTTNEGMWDVTEYNTPPILVFTFPNQTLAIGAGYGNFVHTINDAGRDVLLYADEVNGLISYDADNDIWVVPVGLTSPPPADVRAVTLHKDRLWLCVKESSTIYYLDAGNIGTGAATPFHMGSKMQHGGAVASTFSWTVDAGNGLDAMLVVVGTAGDVVVYAGDDPASVETWSEIGSYYIGQIPKGSTFGSVHGGNVYILSVYGLVSMNGLLKGVNAEEALATADNTSTTNKITAVIRATMLNTIDSFGWEVRIAPTEGALIINTPHQGSYVGSVARIQYVFSLTMEAWGFWRNLPMGAFGTWNDRVVFGTHDNRIVFMDVRVDNELINPPDEINGDDIVFSLLTSFQSYGELGQFKRVTLIRPDFIGGEMPTFRALAAYDYHVDEQVSSVPAAPIVDEAFWNVSLWDEDRWSTGLPDGQNRVGGSFGVGRYVAISIYGRTRERISLVGFDVMYKSGSPLI